MIEQHQQQEEQWKKEEPIANNNGEEEDQQKSQLTVSPPNNNNNSNEAMSSYNEHMADYWQSKFEEDNNSCLDISARHQESSSSQLVSPTESAPLSENATDNKPCGEGQSRKESTEASSASAVASEADVHQATPTPEKKEESSSNKEQRQEVTSSTVEASILSSTTSSSEAEKESDRQQQTKQLVAALQYVEPSPSSRLPATAARIPESAFRLHHSGNPILDASTRSCASNRSAAGADVPPMIPSGRRLIRKSMEELEQRKLEEDKDLRRGRRGSVVSASSKQRSPAAAMASPLSQRGSASLHGGPAQRDYRKLDAYTRSLRGGATTAPVGKKHTSTTPPTMSPLPMALRRGKYLDRAMDDDRKLDARPSRPRRRISPSEIRAGIRTETSNEESSVPPPAQTELHRGHSLAAMERRKSEQNPPVPPGRPRRHRSEEFITQEPGAFSVEGSDIRPRRPRRSISPSGRVENETTSPPFSPSEESAQSEPFVSPRRRRLLSSRSNSNRPFMAVAAVVVDDSEGRELTETEQRLRDQEAELAARMAKLQAWEEQLERERLELELQQQQQSNGKRYSSITRADIVHAEVVAQALDLFDDDEEDIQPLTGNYLSQPAGRWSSGDAPVPHGDESYEQRRDEAVMRMLKGVDVCDRRYRLVNYKHCFVGSEAVDFMVHSGWARTRAHAVAIGQLLQKEFNLFEHAVEPDRHTFEDAYLFFRFNTVDNKTGRTTNGTALASSTHHSKRSASVGSSHSNHEIMEPEQTKKLPASSTIEPLDVNLNQAEAELRPGPLRFSLYGERSLEMQLMELPNPDKRAFKNLKQRWEDRHAKVRSRSRRGDGDLPISWHLRYLRTFAKKDGTFVEDRAYNAEKKLRKRFLYLNAYALNRQLQSKTLFPVPGLKTKGGHGMFYMRPSRYVPGQTSTKDIINNLCYVMNTMLEREHAQQEGIGFIANMDDWAMSNFEINYCYQFMMALQGFMVPVKMQLFLIVNPPAWFGVIWRLMKPMLAPSFRKRVKICTENKISKYLAPYFERYLPDEMTSGNACADTIVSDFIAFRRFAERNTFGNDSSRASGDSLMGDRVAESTYGDTWSPSVATSERREGVAAAALPRGSFANHTVDSVALSDGDDELASIDADIDNEDFSTGVEDSVPSMSSTVCQSMNSTTRRLQS